MKKMLANIITCCRMILTVLLIFFPFLSVGFIVCYLLAGATDVADGIVARRLGITSKFGEKFDTIADIFFVTVVLFRFIPQIEIGLGIVVWIGLIAVIKALNIIMGFVRQKQFVAVHSTANRITGVLLYVLPLTTAFVDIKYSSCVVCLAATFAALQEGYIVLKGTSQ
mgnify:CR=1 FL=1